MGFTFRRKGTKVCKINRNDVQHNILQAHVLPGEKAAVTALAANPNKRHLAVGYIDGVVQVYDLKSAEVISIFSGHRSQITTLAYDSFGHKLTSGSKVKHTVGLIY